MSSYHSRRYKVVDGKLVKRWDSPTDGWFVTKAEAWSVEDTRVAKVANVAKTAAARDAMDKKRQEQAAAKEARVEEKAAVVFESESRADDAA